MMYELLCGKINEKACEQEKNHCDNRMSTFNPHSVLTKSFEFQGPDWIHVAQEAESIFGNMRWMDWGSFLCRGNYEQMKSFLEWGEVDKKTMEKFNALPREGDYGFVFIEDY